MRDIDLSKIGSSPSELNVVAVVVLCRRILFIDLGSEKT